jgi:SAM-dependent methyltransferase
MAIDNDIYNEVPYLTLPERRSHPYKLATRARLHGLSPARVATARILELGCGDGGNATPIAAMFPDCNVVGVDLAARPLQRAHEWAAATSTKNIAFVQASVETFSSSIPFDYVIAHGLASWVAPSVREALFRCIYESLHSDGVGFISFNVLPGSYLRIVMRDACLSRGAGSGPVEDRASRAREMLGLIRDHVQGGDYLPPDTLRAEAGFLLNLPDWYLMHDLLAEEYHPLSFAQFHRELEAAGLFYVCDTSLDRSSIGALPEPVQDALEGQEVDSVAFQSMGDIISQRMFRCAVVARKPPTRMLRTRECLLGPAASYTSRYDVSEHNSRELIGPGGRTIPSASSLERAVVAFLASRWPQWIGADELLDALRSDECLRIGGDVEAFLPEVCAQAMERGVIDLLLESAPRISSTLVPKPNAWLYARQLASQGATVTSLRHEWIDLRPEERRVLVRLDGRTSIDEIGRSLQLTTREVQSIVQQIMGYGLLTAG